MHSQRHPASSSIDAEILAVGTPVPIVNINDTHTHNPSSVLEMFHSPPNNSNLLDGREINHRLS